MIISKVMLVLISIIRYSNYSDIAMIAARPKNPNSTEYPGLIEKDCSDIYKKSNASGRYEIQPDGFNESFHVYCDMETDGGKWTVMQRRVDGSVNFHRKWIDYKLGFGNLSSEFWLGNERLHIMTSQRDYELRVDMWKQEGGKKFAIYRFFRIYNETCQYRLHLYGYHGNAGDAMCVANGQPFCTRDQNNGKKSRYNCTLYPQGAWWYGAKCYSTNLNGMYREEFLFKWYGIHSWRKAEMKIRPVL